MRERKYNKIRLSSRRWLADTLVDRLKRESVIASGQSISRHDYVPV